MSSTRYRILGQVGQGQFGRVLCAVDRNSGLLVALKALNKRELPTRVFLRELRMLASLQHPNIVSVQTISYTAKERYLVMDYCEGGTLRHLLLHPVHLSLEQRLQIIIDVLKGLSYAHQQGIIHCDLKPENILFTHTEAASIARITDFGIARLVEEAGYGVVGQGDTGSPAYMAPERFYGQYSYASDVYAVGVILFELVVGRRPFNGLPGELMTAHLSQSAPIPKAVPFLIRSILKQALQKLPQKRFKSAKAMLEAVELAADVLASEDPIHRLAPSQQLSQDSLVPDIRQETFPSPSSFRCLLVQDNQLYLGHFNQVISRTYVAHFLDSGSYQEKQWTFSQPVIDLWGDGQQAWVRTIQGNTHRVPSRLYGLSTKNQLSAQPRALPTLEVLPGMDWGQNNKMGWLPNHRWIALTCSQQSYATEPAPELGHQAILQIYQWPQMQPVHRAILIQKPDWLFILDARYGVAISAGPSQSQFQGFTRRGQAFSTFSVPIPFRQITQNIANPYQLLAISTNPSGVGYIVDLNPWRLTRIALPFQPDQVIATAWGYILLSADQVLLLGPMGQPYCQFRIPLDPTEKITVAVGAGPGLLIGTQLGTSARLYTIDLRSQLTDWQSKPAESWQNTPSSQTA
ncbi:serine/threonine-protein kinase [Acaryochloris sp. IP29b_bin.137]|uniref:serine/threonine-protein kinase n=1 Tax=Acaryochloris sp. IP29b_bin.137 TaxID=2969217 RepID=UPI002613367C|nr:serine/threonine-protein kinase [Acaryochloris sp. IP29b_bin.137]